MYRNPETLWYQVLEDENQSKLNTDSIVSAINKAGGEIRRTDLIESLKKSTGAGKRTISETINQAELLKHISSKELQERGSPKLLYLPLEGT